MIQRVFFIFLIVIFAASLSSCLVTRKKYDALAMDKIMAEDSLNHVIDKTLEEYMAQKNALLQNNARKNDVNDSLNTRIGRLNADADELKQSLRQTIADYEAEKKKLQALSRDVEEKNKENQRLNADLKEKEKRLSELEKMIEENKQHTERLYGIIAEALNAFDESELNVYQKDGKVYVAVEEKLLFKTGSAVVDPKGREAVEQLSEVLGKQPDIDIVIEGHTDNTGSAALNWKLSTERALSIVDILTENEHIAPKRISASGRGMYAPVASNDTKEGRRKNRRIEIILSPRLDSLYEILNK